jgi:type I restriction enzyme M protein
MGEMATAKTSEGQLEATLWAAADKLRGHMDAAEYKHVALGLIFLKYISDTFNEHHQRIVRDFDLETAEDRDEYTAEGIFWVPSEARWGELQAKAKQSNIGTLIDKAMEALERENPKQLKGVLPKDFARPALDKSKLGELIDLFSNLKLVEAEPELFDTPTETTTGTTTDTKDATKSANSSKDLLGRVYEYFLSKFASAEGKLGGEFYTPGSVVRVIVEMLAPYKGRIYDPACGSGGMFVTSEKFIEAHGGKIGDVSVYGQESNPTTWKLAKMNLAIRGLEANLGLQNADTFHNNQHPDLRADYILANPPFNISDWGGERLRQDQRWVYGQPPVGNANYAWMQHMIYHLAPNGIAGFVLANGSLSSNSSGEGDIRTSIIEADLVDCIVAMPGQLFYTTQIPVSLWFLAKNKKNGRGLEGRTLRDRSGQTLFIDARKLGFMETRVNRNFTDEDMAQIVGTYHNWRGDGGGTYQDMAGFCKSASLTEIQSHGYVLTPGRYVGIEAQEEDSEPFDLKMQRLTQTLYSQFEESGKLEAQIRANLEKLGYGL